MTQDSITATARLRRIPKSTQKLHLKRWVLSWSVLLPISLVVVSPAKLDRGRITA